MKVGGSSGLTELGKKVEIFLLRRYCGIQSSAQKKIIENLLY